MQTKESLSPEWQHIRDIYIAGFQSIREIARRNGLSDTAIRKRAKAEGWTRATPREPAKAPREPVRKTLDRIVTAKQAPATAPIIAQAAETDPSDLVKETRITLNLLHAMLRAETKHQGWFEEIIEEETAGDRSDRRREAMLKAVSMPTLILAAKNLALALKTLTESAPGKKQQAQDAAATAGAGTDWGDDLDIGRAN